ADPVRGEVDLVICEANMRASRPVQCSMEINALKWTSLGEKHEKVSGILHHSVDCRTWWMAGVLFIGFIGCVGIARSQESGRQPLRFDQTISLPNVSAASPPRSTKSHRPASGATFRLSMFCLW